MRKRSIKPEQMVTKIQQTLNRKDLSGYCKIKEVYDTIGEWRLNDWEPIPLCENPRKTRGSTEKFTEDELRSLRSMNERLIRLENEIRSRTRKIEDQLKKEEDKWLTDYELYYEFDFYLREDYPDYREDDENILTCSRTHGVSLDKNGSLNHNDLPGDHPLGNDRHCSLFHHLYDHTPLSWDDILRIGSVWVDIIVQYQHLEHFETGKIHDLTRTSRDQRS